MAYFGVLWRSELWTGLAALKVADIKRQIKHERSLSRELRRQNVAHVDVCVGGGSRAESIPEEGANCRGAEGGERRGADGRRKKGRE